MSARILYTLSDENPDLHNKTDCMNESDGYPLLRGMRIASYSHHKKLTPGRKQTSTTGREPSRAMHEIMEKPASKAANKNQTAPSESSRSSVSSSWSRTSFSSADTYHRTSQPEPAFLSNGMSQETRQWSRNSHGLRDVLKDSIHREAQRLMAMNMSEEENRLSTLKYIDSSRPLTQAKFTKNQVSLLDGSSQNIQLKDMPRFSFDKREMRPSSMRLQEQLPRLLLEGKEQSMRSCGRQNYCLEDLHKRARSSSFVNWQQEPERQGRTLGVVAKLMGLEVLPEPDSFQRFSRSNHNNQNRFTNSLKHANSEAIKPGANIAYHQKANSSTSKSTSNSLLKSHKKQTSTRVGSKKDNAKQTAEDQDSNTSCHGGSSCQPLHNLKKNSSLRPLEMAQALSGHRTPISESCKRPRNHSLQQKNLGLDQQNHQALPSTDSSKTVGYQSKGQKESSFPIRKARPKLQIPKQPESKIDQRDRSHKPYATSVQSESNRSMLRFTNADVRKYEHEKAGDTSVLYTPKQRISNPGVGEETARPDHLEIVQEQPSPVSVLDAIFCKDEPLSPVKKIPKPFKDKEHLNSEEANRNSVDQSDFPNSRGPSLSSENDPNLLLANSMPEDFVIQKTAILYESRHKEHKYISEILSKSGILEDPESNLIITQLHPRRLPLDPDLFLALEQGKECMEVSKDGVRCNRSCHTQVSEKMKRKLIFDTVNEILVQKIVFDGLLKECTPLRVLPGKRAKGHMILQTVFSEIDRLQAHNSNCKLNDEDYRLKSIFREDLMHREREWTDLQGEIPGIALDVERLIFKDLIGEIIIGQRAGSKARPYKHHRRQFPT